MIYQPRNVQPSSTSIDGSVDNIFSMEIQTNSYVSAYQLLIVDFNNNAIYTGSKTTLSNYLYNGDTLEIPVSASSVALSNGTNYKWRVRLYQPNSDMLITYGLVQSTSTTTNIYLQPNINIKAGMTLTINSQSKTISSYNSDTGLAVVSSAFSSVPAVGTQYYIYSDFIETVPDYIVYARRTPGVSISNVPTSLTLKYHTFQGVYNQSDNVPIVYHKFDLYLQNDDGSRTLIDTSDKVYSANLSYTYDAFRTGSTYLIQMTVENDMGVIATTDLYSFNVSYDIVEYLQQPVATFYNKENAVNIAWVTPVEHDATSFRSDAATGVLQDNSDTFTQATFEPGQSIGEGDVVQVTNSDFDMVLYGKSEQETRSGKNLYNYKDTTNVGDGVTADKDGWITIAYDNTNGTSVVFRNYYTNNLNLKTNTNYNIIMEVKNVSVTGDGIIYPISILSNTGGQFIHNNGYALKSLSNNSIKQFTMLTKASFENITVGLRTFASFGAGTKGSITFRLSVLEDTTVTAETFKYEAFGVSPSPDYPSEVKTVKGIRNLFDKDNYSYVPYANVNSTGLIISNASVDLRCIYIKVKPKTTYTISANVSRNWVITTTSELPAIGVQGTTRIVTISKTYTLTTGSTTQYLILRHDNSGMSETQNYLGVNLQIEEGSVAHDYVPYGAWVKVKITNEDETQEKEVLIDLAKENLLETPYTESNKLTATATKNDYYDAIDYYAELEAGKTYTFSCKTDGTFGASNQQTQCYLLFDKKYDYIIHMDDKNCFKFTPTQTGKYYVRYDVNVKGETHSFWDFAIYKGTNADDSYELNSIGDIKDNLEIINGVAVIQKRIGKVVLNGSESWILNGNQFAISGVNYKTNSDGALWLNTHFQQNVDNDKSLWIGNNAFIIIRYDEFKTTDELKKWLSNNPVTVYYMLETPEKFTTQSVDTSSLKVDGKNYLTVSTNIDSTFDLIYPYKTITGNTNDYTLFNPAGVSNTGTIKSYNALTGVATLMADRPFTYIPMKGDSYAVISNIYNVSGFSYLYNTPYNTVNSLYTHGYTATWSTPDGLCVLPNDFNITLQFSPDSNFYYDKDGVYQEIVNLITTETDGENGEGQFDISVDKNKLVFTRKPDISLEAPFYTGISQVFVLSSNNVAQINNDYIWDDTATWTDTYTWVEGGTSLERICNHWWKVQITNTTIKVEEIYPTA